MAPSGRRFRVESAALWRGRDWESPIELRVSVGPGEDDWYEGWPYGGWSERGGPVPDPPGGWKEPSPLAWPAAGALLVALMLGIGTLGFWVAGASDVLGLAVGLLLTVVAVVLLRRVETRRRPIRRD